MPAACCQSRASLEHTQHGTRGGLKAQAGLGLGARERPAKLREHGDTTRELKTESKTVSEDRIRGL